MSKGKPVSAIAGSLDPESQVDDSNSTLWNASSKNGWFEIDLRRICALEDFELSWADGKKPESVKVTYKVRSGQETEALGEDPFRTVIRISHNHFETLADFEVWARYPIGS